MLLRNKLSLIALFFFAIAAAGLILALNYRNDQQAETFARNAAQSQESLWEKVVDGDLVYLEARAAEIRMYEPLLHLLDKEGQAGLRDALITLFGELQTGHDVDRLELYKRDGSLFFSSERSYYPPRTLSEADVKKHFSLKGHKTRGLLIDSERQTVVASSVRVGDEALVVISFDVSRAMAEFKNLAKADSFLINRRGRLLSGQGDLKWDEIAPHVTLAEGKAVQTLAVGEQYFGATLSLTRGAFGDIGYTLTLRDVTQQYMSSQRLKWVTYSAMALFLIVSGGLLWMYLRHALSPLGEAIDVLGSLSEGDYTRRLTVRDGRDEVAQIGKAITKFHSDLLRLDRMKKARDNRGRRQSMIIRRELSQLAETLDEQNQKDVLQDLADIEARFEGQGNKGDLQSANELAAMALTLRRLRGRIENQHRALAETIEELEEALKSKTAYLALQQELATGARVQAAMLPDELPETEHLRISGTMRAAKEVGGDFYDFFYLDENRLGVVIADVSGKGIPASLFMAISRSVLRATAPLFESPAACIAALNDELCDNNKEELFVTLFYGIFDLRDHRFIYTNAGHGPAYHIHAGNVVTLALTGDVALGVMDGLEYSEAEIQLQEGDSLFFYTDGITEAMNEQDEEFGAPALEDVLSAHGGDDVDDLQRHVVAAVERFAGTAPQFDDITCSALKVKRAKGVRQTG